MLRAHIREHGGPDGLVVEDVPVPTPGPGQVLIRAEAIGLNYVDTQIRRETDPASIYYRPAPTGLTADVVGVVEAGVAELIGRRVAVLLEDGCAQYVVADTDWLVPVPDDLPAATATLIPTVGAVALGALTAGRLAAGETVLIHAGAGAIGHMAVQLARLRGAGTVVATAGSAAKLELLTALGADVAVDYSRPGWTAEIPGIDLAIDGVGGDVLHQTIELLPPGGRAVVFGAAAGDLATVPVTSLFPLRTLTGFALFRHRLAFPDQARADLDELTSLLHSGTVRPTVTTLPLAEAREAHRRYDARTVQGRLVLTP